MITPEARERLAELMEQRMADLRLTWREVAETGDISYEALRAARNGSGDIRRNTQAGIEAGLRWERGSVARILAGGDPVPLGGAVVTLPPAAVPRARLAEVLALHRDESDVFPQMDEEMTIQVERHLPAIEAAYIFAVAGSDGPPAVMPRGDEVFPGSPHEAERWDTLIAVGLGLFPERGGFSAWQMTMLAAVGRVRDSERRAGNPAARVREA